jgi:hypothetical protein
MDKIRSVLKSPLVLSIALLVLVSAASYLPFIGRFGYLADDWYEMYAAGAHGPQVFHSIFAIDRPGRAYLMIPLYTLFGQNALPYNVTAYLFRLLGGLALLWTLRALWPARERAALLAALFFTIYPGFLSQPNAIDFQSHIAGLFFAILSIALTVQAILNPKLAARIALTALSIFFGLAYLSQMEYYIGFEIVRLVFIFVLARGVAANWKARLLKTVWMGLPFLLAPALFVTWRLFFFESARKATDLGVQLAALAASPLHTLLGWTINLFQDALDVLVFAWTVPPYQASSALTPLEFLAGLGLAAVCILCTLLVLRLVHDPAPRPLEQEAWRTEAFWAGLAILFGGLIPVTIANRSVSFPDYTRYTLISLTGAVIILAVALDMLKDRRLQLALISLLAGLAVLTHFANGLSTARQAEALRAFWWQVSWRIPQIKPGTTLIARYPVGGAPEDYFVWGPANLIFYPDSQSQEYVQPAIFGATLDRATITKVLAHMGQQYVDRRGIHTYANYRNILVLTQPVPGSCVRVIDGSQPEISSNEDERITLLAPYSEAGRVLDGDVFPIPPRVAFGSEPAHGWCYWYEKADYARQRGDWTEVARIGDEVERAGLGPADPIEWMPFLRAYEALGEPMRIAKLAPAVQSDPFVAWQVCRILGLDHYPMNLTGLRGLFCLEN